MGRTPLAEQIAPRAIDGQDRREASRSLAVYKIVRIEREGKHGLARCRNLSDRGMKLDVAMPLARHDGLTIEFTPDLVLRAQVVWTNGTQCGVAVNRRSKLTP